MLLLFIPLVALSKMFMFAFELSLLLNLLLLVLFLLNVSSSLFLVVHHLRHIVVLLAGFVIS